MKTSGHLLKNLIDTCDYYVVIIDGRYGSMDVEGKSYLVRNWLEKRREQIEVFFLPSYSPELTPGEYMNCDLKVCVHSKMPTRTKEQLKNKAISQLRKLQKSPNRVRKYFKHPKVAYAA